MTPSRATTSKSAHATSLEPSARINEALAITPAVITTTVTARDHDSAVVLALDRFDEARALLAMADQWRIPQVRPAITARGDEMTDTSASVSSRIVAVAHIDSRGGWHPGYRELSAAAAEAGARKVPIGSAERSRRLGGSIVHLKHAGTRRHYST